MSNVSSSSESSSTPSVFSEDFSRVLDIVKRYIKLVQDTSVRNNDIVGDILDKVTMKKIDETTLSPHMSSAEYNMAYVFLYIIKLDKNTYAKSLILESMLRYIDVLMSSKDINFNIQGIQDIENYVKSLVIQLSMLVLDLDLVDLPQNEKEEVMQEILNRARKELKEIAEENSQIVTGDKRELMRIVSRLLSMKDYRRSLRLLRILVNSDEFSELFRNN